VGCEALSRAVVYDGRGCLESSCGIRGEMKLEDVDDSGVRDAAVYRGAAL